MSIEDDYYDPIYTSPVFHGMVGFTLILGIGLALLCLI